MCQGITHKGTLSGIEYVNEAAVHPTFAPHLERLMNGYAEIVEADIPIAGKSARAYSLEFVERIRRVKDDNARINIIETVKLRERAADIVRSPNYDASTELFKSDFAYSFATVLRYLTPGSPPVTGKRHTVSSADDYKGVTDTGETYEIRDPDRTIQDVLKGAFGTNRSDVDKRTYYHFLKCGIVVILPVLRCRAVWTGIGTLWRVLGNITIVWSMERRVLGFWRAFFNYSLRGNDVD